MKRQRRLWSFDGTRSVYLVCPSVGTIQSYTYRFSAQAKDGASSRARTAFAGTRGSQSMVRSKRTLRDIERERPHRAATVFSGLPAEFGRLMTDETEQWGKGIRAANIKPQ
jgi:hypothetical protein